MADVKTNRAIKYRIKPNKAQEQLLQQTFGCVRLVYNHYLGDRKDAYDNNGTSLNYYDNANDLKRLKNELPFLKDVDSISLQQCLRHLDTAYKNFFRDKKVGFPKFKSKKNNHKSYSTVCVNNNISIDSNHIKLPKIGKVKAVIHRVPDDSWTIKSATVSQESDGKYYISVLFEFENTVNPYVADKTNAIGLDYASDGLYVDSNGNTGTNHKYYRESHNKLAKAQRKLSRMQGSKKHEVKSNNYIKQLRKVNKIHRHIANQRLDNLHKISTEIANQYDVVCVESLNMKAMSNKGFGNGKATLDNGYGMLLSMLEYKLSDRNKYLIKVDKWFPSSQICHCCGMLHPEMKNLAIRKMTCDCGLTISRDQNAAINILNEGLRLLT